MKRFHQSSIFYFLLGLLFLVTLASVHSLDQEETNSSEDGYVFWYAIPQLKDEQQFIEQGCFRGSYGRGDQAFSLLTCGIESHPAIAVLPSDAFLCVLELTPGNSSDDLKSFLLSIDEQSLLALPLYHSEGAVVIINPQSIQEVSPLCAVDHFPGLVENAKYVPTQAILPQQLMPLNHPAVQRSLLAPEGLSTNPAIEDYLRGFKKHKIEDYVRWLSTDDKGTNQNITRNSYAIRPGAGGCLNDNTWRCAHHVVDQVVAEVEDIMDSYPHKWYIEKVPFRADMCSNIRLVITGAVDPDSIVVIGAHLDSRNTNSGAAATGPAPGADDNASGSAVNLEIVRAIAANERKHQFEYSVHILWFCGEEQGLLGSSAMAKAYKADGAKIIGMFNNDMIGYTDPNIGMVLSFMKGSATKWLTDSCKVFASIYVPNLKSADTGACCSDQQSFYNNGFAAAGIFETPTSGVVYPAYHKTTDTWNNGYINYEQIYLFGLANFCCILEYAVPITE